MYFEPLADTGDASRAFPDNQGLVRARKKALRSQAVPVSAAVQVKCELALWSVENGKVSGRDHL